MQTSNPYRSIFSPSTRTERSKNFEDYWTFDIEHSGQILEDEKNLTKKKDKLEFFQTHAIRSRMPLADPEVFYKNYVHLKDDPTKMDRKTLLLTCIYKFARHEWVGISGAWDYLKPVAQAKTLTDRISRYHLCEEFCHVRYFHEMFKIFHLDKVEWVPLGPVMQKVYGIFPYFPESLMAAPAFVTELMGITFYHHVDAILDDVFADEPEAKNRVRELLHEIMVDELAHIGQRRNFMGPLSTPLSKKMVSPIMRMFFKDIPESKYLFNVDQMVEDALTFDYSRVRPELMKRTWVPSYCKTV